LRRRARAQAPAATDTTGGTRTAGPTSGVDAAEGATAAAAPRPAGGGLGRRWTWLAAAVAVVAIALAVAALTLRPSSDDEVRESALLAARTYTQSLVTYDASTLEEDIARVRRASTEQFAAQYQETIDGLRETIVGEQRVSTGTILGAGLEDLDDTTATVLVAVDQQLTSSAGEPRTEANRLRMVLERSDGQWLIKSVTRL